MQSFPGPRAFVASLEEAARRLLSRPHHLQPLDELEQADLDEPIVVAVDPSGTNTVPPQAHKRQASRPAPNDSKNRCVSCDIPIRLLGLSVAEVFAYIFDFGDCHTFRITVLDIQAGSNARSVPALLSCRGKNIIQYRATMPGAEARAFENRPPTIAAPEPSRFPSRIRFIRDADGAVLMEWRASNNKKLWQKAVAILENRNLSPENIAAKIERPEGGAPSEHLSEPEARRAALSHR